MRDKVRHWKVITHDNRSVISTRLKTYDTPSKYVKTYSEEWTEAFGDHGLLVFETRAQARHFKNEMREFAEPLKVVRVECEGPMSLPTFCIPQSLAKYGVAIECFWYDFPEGTLAFRKVRIIKDKHV